MLTKRYPALFITDSVIQIAKLNGAGTKFVYYHQLNVPQGVIINGEIKKIDDFVTLLKTFRTHNTIKDTHCIIGVSDHKATVETVEFSGIADNEIHDAILHKANSFLPFPIEEEYFDWMILSNSGPTKTILFSAIPKTVLDIYTVAFQKAGMIPMAFENRSLTVYRMIPKTFQQLTVVLNVGFTDCTMVLLKKQKLVATTVIPITQDFLPKLHNIIVYYLEKADALNLQKKLYVTGKNASIIVNSNIPSSLAAKAELLDAPIKNIPQGQRTEYALIACLCNKKPGLPQDTKSIVLLPTSLVKIRIAEENTQVIRKLGILLIIGSIIILVVSLFSFLSIVKIYRDIQKYAVKTPSQSSSVITYPVKKLTVLRTIFQERTAYKKAIDSIFDEAEKEGIQLSGIKINSEQKTITILGTSQTRQGVINYRSKLNDTDLFSFISLPLSTNISANTVPFRMTTTL